MGEVQFAKQFLTTLDSKNNKYKSDHVFDPQSFQTRIPYTLPKLGHPPHPLPPKPASLQTSTPIPGSEPATSSQPSPPTINLVLKSTRNPTFTLHLPSLPPSTPISTLKSQIQSLLQGTVATEKIKVLHSKKPIPASKGTIHDVLAEESSAAAAGTGGPTEVEFGVMILGGAPDPVPATQTVTLNNEVEAPRGPGSEDAAAEAVLGVASGDVHMQNTPAAAAVPVPVAAAEVLSEKMGAGGFGEEKEGGRAALSSTEFWDDLQGFLEQRLRDTAEAERLRGVFERAAR